MFASLTGYRVDILRVSWDVFYKFLKNDPVILLQSPTSTGYFSNSTGSFVTNCRFSPNIGLQQPVGEGKGLLNKGGSW